MHDGTQALRALLHNSVYVSYDESKSLEVGAKFLEVSKSHKSMHNNVILIVFKNETRRL